MADLGSAAAGEGVNVAVMKEATLVQMTWPGAPTLYYGDEAGQVGFTDPDNRRTYPWDNADYALIDFNRDMIMLHRLNPALKRGSFIFLRCDDNFISYGRFTRDQQLVVVVNSSDKTIERDVPVWLTGVPDGEMEEIMLTNETGYSIMPVKYSVDGGNVHVTLQAYTAMVLRHNF